MPRRGYHHFVVKVREKKCCGAILKRTGFLGVSEMVYLSKGYYYIWERNEKNSCIDVPSTTIASMRGTHQR